MLLNSIYGNTGCSTCGCNYGVMPTAYAANNGGCNSCGNYGSNLGNAAYNFIGDWVNIVVTLTILQSILGLVCNWNCGCNN